MLQIIQGFLLLQTLSNFSQTSVREMKGILHGGPERCSDIQCVLGVSHSPDCQLYFIRALQVYRVIQEGDGDGWRARDRQGRDN